MAAPERSGEAALYITVFPTVGPQPPSVSPEKLIAKQILRPHPRPAVPDSKWLRNSNFHDPSRCIFGAKYLCLPLVSPPKIGFFTTLQKDCL